MIGDIAIGGVFVPALLLLGALALALTGLISVILNLVGAYRWVAYRPIVDVAIFILLLGLLVILTAPAGTAA